MALIKLQVFVVYFKGKVVHVSSFKADSIVVIGNNKKALLLVPVQIIPFLNFLNGIFQLDQTFLWLVILHHKNTNIDKCFWFWLNIIGLQ